MTSRIIGIARYIWYIVYGLKTAFTEAFESHVLHKT